MPESQRSVDAAILYVTDRQPLLQGGRVADYGVERSDSMARGTALVRFGGFGSWGELVDRSESSTRTRQQATTEG